MNRASSSDWTDTDEDSDDDGDENKGEEEKPKETSAEEDLIAALKVRTLKVHLNFDLPHYAKEYKALCV